MMGWLIVSVAGALALAVGYAVNPAQAAFSYLTAYIFALGIVLGALILVMIEQLIAAAWFVAIRRAAERVASALPVFVPLFVPVVIGVRWLYPWTNPSQLDEHARSLVAQKIAYLNLPFFFVRAALYFVCWIVIGERLRRLSLRQDREPGVGWSQRMRTLSAPGLIVVAFTMAFASIDWLMSLSPTWFSTIFGVQIFAGAMLAALAVLAFILGRTADPTLAEAATADHCSAIGKMILTFAIFWAYTSFAQLLIIWIADLPDEVTWYVVRTEGSWLGLGLLTAAGQFVVPFSLMLSYEWKRRRRLLAALGGWLLAAHYIETYWIVMPQLHPAAVRPHWLDAAAAAAVIGAAVAFGVWRAQGQAPVPIGDPELDASLRYSEA